MNESIDGWKSDDDVRGRNGMQKPGQNAAEGELALFVQTTAREQTSESDVED